MGFLSRKQAMACALLMVLLANAQNQPVLRSTTAAAVHSNSTCCSVTRFEDRLTSIERRLNDVQRAIASVNDPLISQNCTIDMASNGFDDSTRYGYVITSASSSEEINAAKQMDVSRNFTLIELDPTTCRTRNRQGFDTYVSAEERVQLLETLESATWRAIIVGVTSDAVADEDGAFQESFGSFFTRYNMNITGLRARDKFAFILQKGYPKKTVFQRKARYEQNLKMEIQLIGYTVADVTFKLV